MYFTITTRSKACVIGARAWARPLVAVGGNFLENMCVLWLRVATDEREKFVGNFPVRHVICLGETCLLFKRDLCLGQRAAPLARTRQAWALRCLLPWHRPPLSAAAGRLAPVALAARGGGTYCKSK